MERRRGRDRGCMWRPVIASILAEIQPTQKINIYIIQPGLRWLLIDYFKHNNQSKTGGAVKESRERRRDYRGSRGGCKSIVLATIEWVG